MQTLLPSAPPERLIENEGDMLTLLRRVRNIYLDKYEQTGRDYYITAASQIAELMNDTAVADEPILSEATDVLRPLGDGQFEGLYVDSNLSVYDLSDVPSNVFLEKDAK